MSAAFIAGDWVFCEYELRQVTRTDGDRVTDTTTGMFSHGGYDLSDRCFPLSIETKLISEQYEYWSGQIHAKAAHGVNHPDIHRWLVDHWASTMRMDKSNHEARLEELKRFADHIIAASSGDSGYGFPLMRPR